MKKINYKSDFDFVLRLTNADGVEIGFPSYDWRLVLYTASDKTKVFEASSIAGTLTNCYDDGGAIHVVCDSHGLSKGVLLGEFHSEIPNAVYADGTELTVTPFQLGIVLVDASGDLPKECEVETTIPAIIVTAYELAVKQGYEGTEEQWTQAMTDINTIIDECQEAASAASLSSQNADTAEAQRATAESGRVAAENARSSAETARANAESGRVSAENARSSAETSRANAESDRVAAENARSSAESARATAESIRSTAETSRQMAETARVNAEKERATAENARSSAESARATAESGRVSEFATLKSESQTATNAANAAAASFTSIVVQAAGSSTSQVMSQKATTDAVQDVQDALDVLTRDFAQYAEESPIALTAAQSNKAVDITGSIVGKSGYAVSTEVSLKKGNIYLYRTANGTAIAQGVALCARHITSPTPVMISYTYTYDAQQRITLAVADHDSSLRYTYAYDSDDVCTITDPQGNVIDYLPEVRIAEVGSYVPMFKSLSDTIPLSGYYAIMCNEDCDAVFSAPTALQQVKVVSYGILRSLANQKEDKAVVAQINEKVADLAEQTPRNTHDIDCLLAPRYDGDIPTLCGQPAILFGSGAPIEANMPYNWVQFTPEGNPLGSLADGTASIGYNWNGSPSALGQQYYDVSGTNAVHYIAVRQTFDASGVNYYTLIWKQC